MPTPVKRKGSKSYWLRRRVPERYRAIVGKGEIWKSLDTAKLKRATARCAIASIDPFATRKRFMVINIGLIPYPDELACLTARLQDRARLTFNGPRMPLY